MTDETRTPAPQPDGHPTATHAPDPDATLVRPSAPASDGAGVPGFTIEGTLGRGGMGVVYKAKQTGLNRVVALKMLLAGPFADPSLRARFLLEAESVAALEHPHIVKVFAFGDSPHPYLAMEFLPGGTLAERIKSSGPLSAPAATELLAKLAAAVAHAHSRGVVHRDIKPLNVLLTADGEPRLTDFGLAKVGRADHNLSVTGQVLGTPAYMAPEQAAGKVHEVGTAADVYALGAVLYDALTGRPPFTGDSAAVTLQKVISEEPERPRKHNPAIPRDLETICLKCLEKDAAKRYPTAQALADDLLRYLRNEPISVRPAGALERAVKWVKRNKVVAGAIAAVGLALLTGAGVSLGFGLEARKQEKEALKQKKVAEAAAEREKGEAARAEREKQDAINVRNQLTREQGRRNRTLARALLGPIAANDRGAPLTPYEQDALWELAALRGNEVTGMFLEEVTGTRLALGQLECRAEYALHATVGLDPARRQAADRLLFSRLSAPQTSPEERLSAALAAARSGAASQETAAAAAVTLNSAGAKMWDRPDWAAGVAAAAAQMEPKRAEAECDRAAEIIVDIIRNDPDPTTRQVYAERLALVARANPTEATKQSCATAAQVLAGDLINRRGGDLTQLATGLGELTPWLGPSAADVANQLAEKRARQAKASDDEKRAALGHEKVAETLTAVAGQMTPTAASAVLAKALEVEYDSRARKSFAAGLASAVTRATPAEVAEVCRVAARALTNALLKEDHSDSAAGLVTSMAVVAARAEEAAAASADTLATAFGKTTNPFARGYYARGLAAMAGGMDRAQAARLCSPTGKILAAALAEPTTPNVRRALALGLAAVAEWMDDPIEARRVCREAAQRLADEIANARPDEVTSSGRGELAEGLAALAERMDRGAAAKVCGDTVYTLAAALTAEIDSAERSELSRGLVAVAGWMEPAGAAVCVLAQVFQEEEFWLPSALAAVAARTAPAEAEAACFAAARVLSHRLAAQKDPDRRVALAQGLAAVARRMVPAEAAQLFAKHAHPDLAEELAEFGGPTERVFVARTLLGQNVAFRELPPLDFSAIVFGVPSGALARIRRTPGVISGAFTTPHTVLPSLPLLHPHFHPQPRPLPPQDLVELLKHPFCVGEARRAVLDALEFTYKRPFKDQWEFVEYAQQHQKHLDLLTPPKRPEPRP